MCGRYTLHASPAIIAQHFRLSEPPDLAPRYNIAPSQQAPVILGNADNRRMLVQMHWGLIPSWWRQDPKVGYKTINARAEGIASKPFFRGPFRSRRCLVATDGFYEWRGDQGRKQPYFIHLKGDGVFAFAGLWDRWQAPDGDVRDTFSIITTDANSLLSQVHHRMPVVISPDDYDLWLDPDNRNTVLLEHLLTPFDPEGLDLYPVSPRVNSPLPDDPSLIEPLAASPDPS